MLCYEIRWTRAAVDDVCCRSLHLPQEALCGAAEEELLLVILLNNGGALITVGIMLLLANRGALLAAIVVSRLEVVSLVRSR